MTQAKYVLTIILMTLVSFVACAQKAPRLEAHVYVQTVGSKTGWLGVSIQDMTGRLAKHMDVNTTEGALVRSVEEESPADEAGIKKDDIIIEVGGKKIADADDLREAVASNTPGAKVGIVIMRKNDRKTLSATLERSPRRQSFSYAPTIPHTPDLPMDVQVFVNTNRLGMSLSTLNKQLGKYFEAPDGRGVLVQEVEEDSPAQRAGIKAGDVIVEIGKERIEEPRDVHYALRDFSKGEKAPVNIIRKGEKKTLTLEVPEISRRSRWHSEFDSGMDWQKDFELNLDEDFPYFEDRSSFREEIRDLRDNLREMGKSIRREASKIKSEIADQISDLIG
jgi:C-terminal processing protease CtpA/Prc